MRSTGDTLASRNHWLSPYRRRIAASAAALALLACSGDTVRTGEAAEAPDAAVVAPTTTTTVEAAPVPPSEALNRRVESYATELATTLQNALGDTEGVTEDSVTTYDVATTDTKHIVITFARTDADELTGVTYEYGVNDHEPVQKVAFEEIDGYWQWAQYDRGEQIVDVRAAETYEVYEFFGSGDRVMEELLETTRVMVAAETLAGD